MFHQFEGLLVDREVSVTHLKGILDYFAREFFGAGRRTRLRPFHFRFTEPSFEVDISCGICNGSGRSEDGNKCRLCKEGWLELGGAGMLHPNVLTAGGIDPEEYSALAFGWGVERTMMMRSGIMVDDIRVLYKSDFRFLNQF
jgi:phenylalanyl-tRNA synthetase alpha chain